MRFTEKENWNFYLGIGWGPTAHSIYPDRSQGCERQKERGKNKSVQGRVAEWVPRRVLRSVLQSSSKAIFKQHSSAGACQFDHFKTCGHTHHSVFWNALSTLISPLWMWELCSCEKHSCLLQEQMTFLWCHKVLDKLLHNVHYPFLPLALFSWSSSLIISHLYIPQFCRYRYSGTNPQPLSPCISASGSNPCPINYGRHTTRLTADGVWFQLPGPSSLIQAGKEEDHMDGSLS